MGGLGASVIWTPAPLPSEEESPQEGSDLSAVPLGTAVDAAVPAVSPRATLRELIYRMLSEGRTAFLVWREAPLGVVTVWDLLAAFAAGRPAKATRVEEVMGTEEVYVVDPGAPLLPVLGWMEAAGVPLVVLLEKGEVRGVLTVRGALGRLGRGSREGPRPTRR